ncbi:MAG: sialate O-acetylesterase [Prevotellaceae bacterium]|jgi:sialate O-acetylesterase|nr:sialate O-acetylesterase [Prevotellaceae bacterium]
MKTYVCKVILLCFLVSVTVSVYAAIQLPAIISDHMVLQQNSTVKLWGWSDESKITVKAGWEPGKEYHATVADGKWLVSVYTPGAGGPYDITIASTTQTIVLADVLLGEVWLCSGQSNMQMSFRGYNSQPVYGSNDVVANSADNDIRLFTVTRKTSPQPVTDCEGEWKRSQPSAVVDFSAVAYVYGKYLHEVLQVPIGLIHSSWGGSPAEAWMDSEALKKFPEIDLSERTPAKTPAYLFNAMIYPIIDFGIRGVIWYQGEENRTNPALYRRLFPAMIDNWRALWQQGDFPFYFVQIAPYKYSATVNTAYLREAQLDAMRTTNNTGMAVTMDIGEYETIHPGEKITVGKRLAYWALAKTYQLDGIAFSGPVYKTMEVAEHKVILHFEYADNGFTTLGKPLDGFTVAGSDKRFYPATAIIKGKTVEVTCDSVPQPVAVRYGWENFTVGTLFNNAGLPASSFRTDDWSEE